MAQVESYDTTPREEGRHLCCNHGYAHVVHLLQDAVKRIIGCCRPYIQYMYLLSNPRLRYVRYRRLSFRHTASPGGSMLWGILPSRWGPLLVKGQPRLSGAREEEPESPTRPSLYSLSCLVKGFSETIAFASSERCWRVGDFSGG